MLCKRGTSMISANFFCMCKKKKMKNNYFVLFEINERQCLNTPKRIFNENTYEADIHVATRDIVSSVTFQKSKTQWNVKLVTFDFRWDIFFMDLLLRIYAQRDIDN